MGGAAAVLGLRVAPAFGADAEAAPGFAVDTATPFGAKLLIAETPVPAMNLPILGKDGSVTRMNAYPGQVVVATLWATWCGTCLKEMAVLDRMAPRFTEDNIRILPIAQDNGDDAFEQIEHFYDRVGVASLGVLIDADRLNSNALTIRGTPTSFIIDKSAMIVAAIEGDGHFDTPEALRYLRHLANA